MTRPCSVDSLRPNSMPLRTSMVTRFNTVIPSQLTPILLFLRTITTLSCLQPINPVHGIAQFRVDPLNRSSRKVGLSMIASTVPPVAGLARRWFAGPIACSLIRPSLLATIARKLVVHLIIRLPIRKVVVGVVHEACVCTIGAAMGFDFHVVAVARGCSK